MMEIGLTYRAWEDDATLQPKGWVAKTNSKVLNEKRKQIPWVRRRQAQEVTADGRKQRRRFKHRTEFIPNEHIINNNGETKEKNKRYKIDCCCVIFSTFY